FIAVALVAATGFLGCASKTTKENNTAQTADTTTPTITPSVKPMANYTIPYTGAELDKLTSNPKQTLVIETVQGTIKLKLFDKIAPKHVANIIKLAKEHFYDGTTFHRCIPGFMIQGGDPNSKDDNLGNDGIGG